MSEFHFTVPTTEYVANGVVNILRLNVLEMRYIGLDLKNIF